MNRSEQINELAAALATAQGQMGGAKKESDNPFFKSKYADLASVVDAIRGPFAEHGLSYVQAPKPIDGERVCVETLLMHASGQWISSEVDVPVSKQDAQGYGSALTYARRYGLQAIAGVAAEDDDGNAAAGAKPKPTDMTPRRETVPVPRTQEASMAAPPLTTFELNGVTYATQGITKELLLDTFRLVPLVNKKMGKGYAEQLLKDEFGCTSRKDLTLDTAGKYVARLNELVETA